MAESMQSPLLNSESLNKAPSWKTNAAIICSASADLIMAFLIFFGILQSCSPANIVIFLILFGVSVLLVFCGIIMGAVFFRRTRDRRAITSLYLAILYAALLVFLIQLMGTG